jgi:hypothetical protein
MRGTTPVVRVSVDLSRIVRRAGHGQFGMSPSFAALDVINRQVLARRQLVLGAAAQLTAAIIRTQSIVPDPPPLW